jgi:hypothetical protein
MSKALLLAGCLALASVAGRAQEPAAPQTPAGQQPATTVPEHTPEPYRPEEFPQWLRDLRRGEIVFFGSLPFTFFFTFEVYDTARWLASGFDADGFDPMKAPWPVRSGADLQYSDAEKGWLLVSALTASLAVAVADHLIVRFSRERR